MKNNDNDKFQDLNEEYRIVPVLMERDGLSVEDAVERVETALQYYYDALQEDQDCPSDPEDVLNSYAFTVEYVEEEFGLEPDYVDDFLNGDHREFLNLKSKRVHKA